MVVGRLRGSVTYTTLPDSELDTLFAGLAEEEASVSRRRAALHQRIEFVNAGGGASADLSADQLETLQASERELSNRRLMLHQQIDELKAERSRRLLLPSAG